MQRLPKFSQEQHLAQSLKTPFALEKYEKFSIGAQIRRARTKAGMTQHELAQKLKTSQSVVARIENGKQNVTVKTLIAIASILGKKLHIRLQ